MDLKLQNSNGWQNAPSRHHIFAFDILLILCALVIFGRHSHTMFGCDYGTAVNNALIELTSPVMTCFFMLSGFVCQYTSREENFADRETLFRFWLKRISALFPVYLCINFLWLALNPQSFDDWLFLQPVELLGIQSSFHTLFGILHNGGSWFISCMFFCYLLLPLLHMVLHPVSKKKKLALYALCWALTLYAAAVNLRFSLQSAYADPSFRLLEFVCGMLTASLLEGIGEERGLPGAFFAMLACLTAFFILPHIPGLFPFNVKVWANGYLIIPEISILLTLGYLARFRALENNRLLRYLGAITYHFYIFQLVLWPIVTLAMNALHLEGNGAKKACSFLICIALGILSRTLIDRPVRKLTLRAVSKPQNAAAD